MRVTRPALVAFAAAMALAPCEAFAVEFGFHCVTANSVANCMAGESQFSLGVQESPDNRIRFDFRNLGPEPSVIARVYFDGAPMLWELYSIGNYPGTFFVPGGSPPGLPGGNEIVPPFEADYRATAIKPEPFYGIGPGEKIKVVFTLAPGYSFDDALGQMMNGTIRVGIQALSWTNEESDSFVSGPPKHTVVPEPSMGLLALLAALAAARHAHRRRT